MSSNTQPSLKEEALGHVGAAELALRDALILLPRLPESGYELEKAIKRAGQQVGRIRDTLTRPHTVNGWLLTQCEDDNVLYAAWVPTFEALVEEFHRLTGNKYVSQADPLEAYDNDKEELFTQVINWMPFSIKLPA